MAHLRIRLNATHFSSCGGSIISPNVIITAAHCTIHRVEGQIIVRVGTKYSRLGGELFRVKKLINHPNYNNDTNQFDAAILQLAKNIVMKPGVKEIIKLAAPTEKIADGSLMMTSGWGDTKNVKESDEMLRAVEIPIVNQEKCKSAYSYLTNEMMCAGYFETGGKDSCQGEIEIAGLKFGLTFLNFR